MSKDAKSKVTTGKKASGEAKNAATNAKPEKVAASKSKADNQTDQNATTAVTEPVNVPTDQVAEPQPVATDTTATTDADVKAAEHTTENPIDAAQPVVEVEKAVQVTKTKAEISAEHKAAVAANKQRAREEREAKKAAKAATPKEKPFISERFSAACELVSQYHKEFIGALDRKCALLGTERSNERAGTLPEMGALNQEIKETKAKLQSLLEKKRSFDVTGASPEYVEACKEVNRLRKLRSAARVEKQAALEEANAK